MNQRSFKKTMTGVSVGLVLATGFVLPAAAQDLSPLEMMKSQFDNPITVPNDVVAVAKFQMEMDKIKGGTGAIEFDWKSVGQTDNGMDFEKFKFEAPVFGTLKARTLSVSGITETDGVLMVERLELEDFFMKDESGAVMEGERAVYGPVLFDGSTSGFSRVLNGEDAPDVLMMENVEFEDDVDEFIIDFIGWSPSPTGEGAILALENMSGTSEDAEFDNPLKLSVGQVVVDGVNNDSLANIVNFGNDLAEFDIESFDFRSAKISNFEGEVDGFMMKLTEISTQVEKIGDKEKTVVSLEPFIFGGDKAKDEDIRAMFELLDLDEIAFKGRLETLYDPNARTASMTNSHFEMIDWFDFEIAYEMSNVDKQSMMDLWDSEATEDEDSPAANSVYEEFSVTLTDKSGVDKMLSMYADAEGISKESARSQALLMISILGFADDPASPNSNKLMKDLANFGSSFVRSGGSLTMNIDPEPGLAVKDIDKLTDDMGDEAISRMGLSISYSPVE